MEFRGGTLEQYDQVIEKMGFAPGGTGPSGLLFHWATRTDGGIRVTDVWERKDAFDEFAQNQIMPITQELGIPGPPDLQFFEVHSFLREG